jgi:hypothetical protein
MLSRALLTVTSLLATIELRLFAYFHLHQLYSTGVERSYIHQLFCALAYSDKSALNLE